MKLLFDQNISYRIVGLVSDKYPQAKHIDQVGLEDKYQDIDVIRGVAQNEPYNKIIITLSASQEFWTEKLEIYNILEKHSDNYEVVS